MIIGIGCDMVDHEIAEKLNWLQDENLLRRFLSEKELELLWENNSIKFLAGRFAVKEAVLKCLGTGMQDGISLSDIQILQLQTGEPTIEITGMVKKISDGKEIGKWHLSISHSLSHTVAFVVAEKY
ncbi:MAG: holo-ACP synthase [Lewinellaceae bacterium]|nr:holo-ACP synthase [Saprospiraceae bacterium]MCB9338435.1 holo-ACP synthase [Lewinellaceae bacterium]